MKKSLFLGILFLYVGQSISTESEHVINIVLRGKNVSSSSYLIHWRGGNFAQNILDSYLALARSKAQEQGIFGDNDKTRWMVCLPNPSIRLISHEIVQANHSQVS